MKRLFYILCGVISVAACTPGLHNGKADLSVLYVGGQPDYETYSVQKSAEARDSSVRARMAAFETMLKEYFDSVEVIRGDDYKPEMSEDYDVTVFDGRIPAVKPQVIERDAEGNVIKYVRAQLLPEDFDCAAVTIASMGEILGRAIGSKNDWYCLCLDAQAHSLVEDHPVFKGPFKTKLTFEKCPTPEDAFHYTYYYDGEMPDSLMMWRVQTKGYKSDRGFPIGMVSRPWGYEDSPDAEYISSGVCAKTLDAVAIGRHGNFLTWGFAASPAYMTDEAKDVFANAICYIAKFKGQQMLARKYNDRIATREYLAELKYMASMEPYEERVEWTEESNEEGLQRQKEAMAKKARGEKLDEEDTYFLNFTPQKPMTLDEYLERYEKEAYDILGTDLEAYPKYYDENRDYFYGGKGMYVMTVDTTCKDWGIPNNDIRLLDKAITCLETGEDAERAAKVLDRYTLCTFDTPAEWRDWYEKYKDRMFFTESGGWYFMIDGPAYLPGNDYHAKERKAAEQKASGSAEQAADSPVKVSARLVDDSAGKRIEISFGIKAGYHIYREVASSDAYIPVSVEVTMPEGCSAGKLIAPEAEKYGSAGTTVYRSDVTMSVPVKGDGKGTAKVTVGWQCCDAHVCMMPQTVDIDVTI